MVEHDAKANCANEGKQAFIYNAKQNGIPLVIESASATVLCVGPENITRLPENFGGDGVSASNFSGAGILSVQRGLIADKSGIKPGDIIYQFNGGEIADARALLAYLDRQPPATQASVRLHRSGKDVSAISHF